MKKQICIVYGFYEEEPFQNWNVKAFLEMESAVGFKTLLENDYKKALEKHKGSCKDVKSDDLPNDPFVCRGDSKLIYEIEDLDLGDPLDVISSLCKIINKE